MPLKLLIDECLSPELVQMAAETGHLESTCVRNRGWQGTKDWDLIRLVIDHDYTLVTHNARDFRGHGKPAPGGLHAQQDLHAGLICLNSVHTMDLDRQRDLFQLVLDELEHRDDLVNQALEVFEHEDGCVTLQVYDIPAG
jgi:predicted nuclease of predicted toxin-antitoxin system